MHKNINSLLLKHEFQQKSLNLRRNFGVKSVINCTNLAYVPTTIVVAAVVDGFVVGSFGFSPPRQSWLVSAPTMLYQNKSMLYQNQSYLGAFTSSSEHKVRSR